MNHKVNAFLQFAQDMDEKGDHKLADKMEKEALFQWFRNWRNRRQPIQRPSKQFFSSCPNCGKKYEDVDFVSPQGQKCKSCGYPIDQPTQLYA